MRASSIYYSTCSILFMLSNKLRETSLYIDMLESRSGLSSVHILWLTNTSSEANRVHVEPLLKTDEFVKAPSFYASPSKGPSWLGRRPDHKTRKMMHSTVRMELLESLPALSYYAGSTYMYASNAAVLSGSWRNRNCRLLPPRGAD